jgi:hypothetical protein
MQDSRLATNGGTGKITPRQVRALAERWGSLPPAQRAQAEQELEDLIQGLSLAHQEAYRAYFRRLGDERNRR